MAFTFKRLTFAVILASLVFTGESQASNTSMRAPNYARLLEFIAVQDLEGPLVAFGQAEAEFDRQLNQENIDYLNGNGDFLEGIQARLNSSSLTWRLGTSFKQLLVVPESRSDYAQLFEQYCREAIDYLLDQVQMPNPYEAITTFQGPPGKLLSGDDTGVTAYLVHNIANEYIEEYLFFNQADDPDQIRVKLSNREFDGKIGSYTSRLKIGENSRFEFIRESYTLWQNSAEIPFNVFIVPIEETLHILLRPFTELAMQSELAKAKPTTLDQVQSLIDHWMAVEESIVGGVVQQVMPGLIGRFIDGGAEGLLDKAMAARDVHAQYVYLEKGVRVVDQLGVKATMTLYRNSPEEFRRLVAEKPAPMASAKGVQSSLPVN